MERIKKFLQSFSLEPINNIAFTIPRCVAPIISGKASLEKAGTYLFFWTLQNLAPKAITQYNYLYMQERYNIEHSIPYASQYIQEIEEVRKKFISTNLYDRTDATAQTILQAVKASYYAGEITHAYLEGIQYWDTECSIEDIQDILNMWTYIPTKTLQGFAPPIQISPKWNAMQYLVGATSLYNFFYGDNTLYKVVGEEKEEITLNDIEEEVVYYILYEAVQDGTFTRMHLHIPTFADIMPPITSLGIYMLRYSIFVTLPIETLKTYFSNWEALKERCVIEYVSKNNFF